MIVRIWRGPVAKANAGTYADYMRETGLRDYGATPGCLGAWMLSQEKGEEVEFMMVTHWTSWDAIRAFAGEEPERAVYYDRDRAFLTRMDERVEHFELVEHVAPDAAV